MFWRFGFHHSALDTLLARIDITLEEVLDEEDFLQEAKCHNQKLLDFLCKPENLATILNYITHPPVIEDHEDSDETDEKMLKYPFLCSELIACENAQIVDAIMIEHRELLDQLWSFLDQPAPPKRRYDDPDVPEGEQTLDSIHASYFCKVISVLLTKQTSEMLTFIKSDPENLQKILNHLKTSAILDLLLTLVRLEEVDEGKGIVKWLSDQGLLENLVDRLDPYLDSEEHAVAQQCICEIIRLSQTSVPETTSIGLNDLIMDLKSKKTMTKLADFMLDPKAPNATSSFINGVTIIIDLIRHNNSDSDNDPTVNGTYNYGSSPMMREAAVSLADMLEVLGGRIGEITKLLIYPKSVRGPMRTSIGERMPLGFERLKTCELFAEILHCSNMANVNNAPSDELEHDVDQQFSPDLPADSVSTLNDSQTKPSDSAPSLTVDTTANAQQASSSEQDKSGGPLSIGDYVKKQFVDSRVMPMCIDLFFDFPWNNFLHYVIYDMMHQIFNGRMDKEYNRQLAISILKDGKLTTKIVEAQKKNDESCSKPNGIRLGYMGHLTFIADEIVKLFEGYPELIVNEIKDVVDLESWNHYCNHELQETRERDQLPLAGGRPNDETDITASEEEDDDDEGMAEASVSTHQYSQFINHRAETAFDDDDDEDADHWITGRNDFGHHYSYSSGYNVVHDTSGDREDPDGSDEEEPEKVADWTRGFTQFPPANALQRTQSHIREDNEDYEDDEDEYDYVADVNERERRASLMRSKHDFSTDKREEEEEGFGEFSGATSSNAFHEPLCNRMEDVNLNSVSSPGTDSAAASNSYVRAVKTREEETYEQMKEYRPEDDEQEGEI
ncbi:SIT4 phosphatase-associated protein-domain-containing protein [Radiomyces spectabilis]|uniref:SIT4 phosphatase-associated protein-domain-containing protein n=1 Tax=Radiomyces spectabilis TaxID=64574 RepID=UPI0022204EB2|nr:SIT4 phosphatase-associated protein-domain-containing protein [Radiomyces spectabilis]KAI8393932.1 SIT4 phosphatase-associated protein-domain-containing protein [Radiomyces spectabilis]